ncbi:hypothetical protein [Phenylobacterium sp.]|uniref:hypothetical protein n=1 Tax=Phenylobacterium sp. TaxID=1871053 RepID=UPI0025F67626|nr:hypothetical protein [Phenylobacterium sp.]
MIAFDEACRRVAANATAFRAERVALDACGDRECFHRGRSMVDGVRPLGNQDSSAQKDLAMADLLIRRRATARALAPGELVEVLAF